MVKRPGSKKLIVRKLPKPKGAADNDTHVAWRCGNFFIFYDQVALTGTIVDLDEAYFCTFQGEERAILAIGESLMAVRVNTIPIFVANWDDLDDDEFRDAGLETLAAFMEPLRPPDPSALIGDIFDAAQDSILDQLLKPPTKKKK